MSETSSSTFTFTTIFVVEHCIKCGVEFGITEAFQRDRSRDHKYFYCPNSHAQYYSGKSDVERAREEAERSADRARRERIRAEALQDQLQASEKSKAAYKGHLTRTKRRVANGVCPCCDRSFNDLGRHMSSQHPDYGDGER